MKVKFTGAAMSGDEAVALASIVNTLPEVNWSATLPEVQNLFHGHGFGAITDRNRSGVLLIFSRDRQRKLGEVEFVPVPVFPECLERQP
jgi:hypothetical protein